MSKKYLNYYANILETYGLSSTYVPQSDEIPFDYLQFSIGPDEQDRERVMILNVTPTEMTLPTSITPTGEEEETLEHFLQLSIVLPFAIKEGCESETARAILFFNKTLDIPGFGMDEISSAVFYRYSFLKPETNMSGNTLISIIGMILLLLDSLSDPLEAVANGATVADIIS